MAGSDDSKPALKTFQVSNRWNWKEKDRIMGNLNYSKVFPK